MVLRRDTWGVQPVQYRRQSFGRELRERERVQPVQYRPRGVQPVQYRRQSYGRLAQGAGAASAVPTPCRDAGVQGVRSVQYRRQSYGRGPMLGSGCSQDRTDPRAEQLQECSLHSRPTESRWHEVT